MLTRILSFAAAVFVWLLFLYVALVAVTVHLIPHMLSWELDDKLVIFLMVDGFLLALLAWIYGRLPFRPRNRLFGWLERLW